MVNDSFSFSSIVRENFDTIAFIKIRPKKVVLLPEAGRVKNFLSLTRSHSRMCIRIYIFHFKKQASKKSKTKKNTKKEKKLKKKREYFSKID